MAEGKKSFIAYVDWKDTFNSLPDEKAGQLIKFLFAYVNDEGPQTDDVLINAVFANIRQTLKRDLRKYEQIREKRSIAGKASADKRQHMLTHVNKPQQTSTNSTVSVNDNDSDNDIKKDINISFDVFWNLYDKKVGNKAKCQKKWNSLKDAEREKIILTLPKFIEGIREKQYQPYPEKYLSNKRWEDEIPAKTIFLAR